MNTNKFDVLLVEDNADDAELTIRALRKNNLTNTVFHVKSGEEALDLLYCQGAYETRCMQNVPRLILLDLKMPRINGIETLRRIKGNERTKVIPTVILTSSKEDRDIMESYKLGANSYFVKPVDFEGFVDAISSLTQYWLELNQPPNKI
jgi:two-component system response regulator